MDSLNSILHSEFFMATGYFDRLVFALTELSEFHYTPNGRDLFQNVLSKYSVFFQENLEFDFENADDIQFKIATFKKNIKAFHQYTEKFIALPFNSEKKWDFIVNFINITYANAHDMHNFVLKYTQFDIQYPRMALIKEKFIKDEEVELYTSKFFYIDQNDLNELKSEMAKNNKVDFLDMKRDEKYDHFIHAGHFNISEKNYDKAITNFYKALNYKDTAEVYTLLAWAYSFSENYEKSKSYCLKAIAKDANYGPAYNDFGNYLLTEGNVQESFKWFELAKRALNYQNREYPYINAGRAYMALNRYNEAIREFSTALILAPYHEELHETLTKIKKTVEKNTPAPHSYKISEENFHETR